MVPLLSILCASVALGALSPHRHGTCKFRSISQTCDFVVVGAGPGGSFTAYQLAKKYRNQNRKVCLLERAAEPGGRFLDILQPDGFRIPMGGLRWYEFGNFTTKLYTQLAQELGITRWADLDTDVLVNGFRWTEMRGRSSVDPSFRDLNPLYPDLIGANTSDTNNYLYTTMVNTYMSNPNYTADKAGLAHYASSLFNYDTLDFLRDGDRYRSDFDVPLDVASWMEGFIWDNQFDGPRTYPEGGMSELCRRMVAKVTEWGGEVLFNANVTDIEFDNGSYFVTVNNNTSVIAGSSLAIAVPGFDYKSIFGNVPDRIRETQQFQSYLPNEVLVVGQTWPTRFWENSTSGFTCGQAVTQAGYASYAHIFCPTTPYEASRNLTRTVYCDSVTRIQFWKSLYELQGIAGVEAEAVKSMQAMFPSLTIPKPTTTLYHWHPAGWSWLKPGTLTAGINTTLLADWAAAPLPDSFPSCSLVLPTDSWAVRESGWAAGAFGIAVEWLKRCHGVEIDNSYLFCNPYTALPLNQTWCDCNQAGQLLPPEGIIYKATYCPGLKAPQKVYGPRRA